MTRTNIFTIEDTAVRNTLVRVIKNIDPKTKIYQAYNKLALKYHGHWLDCWPVIQPAIQQYIKPTDAIILIHSHADYADITVITQTNITIDRCYNLTFNELKEYSIDITRKALNQPNWTTTFVSTV